MPKIKGTNQNVRAVSKMLDEEASIPYAMIPCSCGDLLIEVVDYDQKTVRCLSCGTVDYYGDRAATYEISPVTGTIADSEYEVSDELLDELDIAKSKSENERTEKEKKLARVDRKDESKKVKKVSISQSSDKKN